MTATYQFRIRIRRALLMLLATTAGLLLLRPSAGTDVASAATTVVNSLVLPSPVAGATDGGSMAVDASGRLHAAYEISLGGQVIYATCASVCNLASNWASVVVGENGAFGSRPIIKLAAGKPRLMYVRDGSSPPQQLIYNACEVNCNIAGNWTELAVENLNFSGTLDRAFFALDAQARPRAVMPSQNDGPLLYFACESACTASANNWTVTTLARATGFQPALTVDGAGSPHVVYKTTDSGASTENDVLAYTTCPSTCTDESNWTAGYIALVGRSFKSLYAIKTSAANQPRIAYYSGNLITSNADESEALIYAWCDSNCADGSSWSGSLIGTAHNDGHYPDLALDGTDRPRISYFNDGSGFEAGFASCSANCSSATGVWSTIHIESPLEYPSAPASGCINPIWYATGPTSIVLDAAGNPHMVFGARNLQSCGGSITEKLRLVRYVIAGTAGTGTATPTITPAPGSTATRTPTATPTGGAGGARKRAYLPTVRR